MRPGCGVDRVGSEPVQLVGVAQDLDRRAVAEIRVTEQVDLGQRRARGEILMLSFFSTKLIWKNECSISPMTRIS